MKLIRNHLNRCRSFNKDVNNIKINPAFNIKLQTFMREQRNKHFDRSFYKCRFSVCKGTFLRQCEKRTLSVRTLD